MSIIKIENAYLEYNEKPVFQDFSLDIQEKEKILITGKSGKGKSTILRLILGFSTLNQGNIYINNKDINKEDIFNTRKNFAYVNQDVTLRSGKVKDVVKQISRFNGNSLSSELDDSLCNYFEFDASLKEKDTTDLSGGERQRLGIIIAIMLDRPVYLLDEISSGLDEELKQKTVDYFVNSDKTVIAVSHDSVWLKNNKFRKVVL